MAKPRVFRIDEDLRFEAVLGDVVGRSMYLHGRYEPTASRALLELIPEGGVFVDVGAHWGDYALLGAAQVGPTGSVLAFEPAADSFQRLVGNVERNGLSGIVTCRQEAVSRQTGLVSLQPGPRDNSGATRVKPVTHGGESVTAVRLSEALEAYPRVDAVKLDVEGHEDDVLAGGEEVVERFRPDILLEVNDLGPDNESAATKMLREWGYGLFAPCLRRRCLPHIHLHALPTGSDLARWSDSWFAVNVLALAKARQGSLPVLP